MIEINNSNITLNNDSNAIILLIVGRMKYSLCFYIKKIVKRILVTLWNMPYNEMKAWSWNLDQITVEAAPHKLSMGLIRFLGKCPISRHNMTVQLIFFYSRFKTDPWIRQCKKKRSQSVTESAISKFHSHTNPHPISC